MRPARRPHRCPSWRPPSAACAARRMPPGRRIGAGLVLVLGRVPGRSRSVSVGCGRSLRRGRCRRGGRTCRLCRRLRRRARRRAGGLRGRRSRFGRLARRGLGCLRVRPPRPAGVLPLRPPCLPLPRAGALPRPPRGWRSFPARAVRPRASRFALLLNQRALARRLLGRSQRTRDSRDAGRSAGVAPARRGRWRVARVAGAAGRRAGARPGRASCAPPPAPPWSGHG